MISDHGSEMVAAVYISPLGTGEREGMSNRNNRLTLSQATLPVAPLSCITLGMRYGYFLVHFLCSKEPMSLPFSPRLQSLPKFPQHPSKDKPQ